MGAWGLGPFDNDDAQDFVLDLADAPVGELERLLTEALSLREGYVEAPDASIAIAAAALVGVAVGLPVPESPTVSDFLSARSVPATAALRDMAKRALDRISGDESELWELWQEAGETSQVEAQLDAVRRVL